MNYEGIEDQRLNEIICLCIFLLFFFCIFLLYVHHLILMI